MLNKAFRFWRRLRPKPRQVFEREAEQLYRSRIGDLRVERGDGFDLVRFEGDHETYRAIQTIANKAKIDLRFVEPENIAFLCQALAAAGVSIRSVLCHGARNAAEQSFFRAQLPEAQILGTEISDTAKQFPMTIEWDFHDVKPEWRGAFDVIFSNSWDHTYDPGKLFPAWLSCVAPNGALVLEWTTIHAKAQADVVDPFRANLDGLVRILQRHIEGHDFAAPAIMRGLPKDSYGRCFVVVRRRSA